MPPIMHKIFATIDVLYPGLRGVLITHEWKYMQIVVKIEYSSLQEMYEKQQLYGNIRNLAREVLDMVNEGVKQTSPGNPLPFTNSFGWSVVLVSTDVMVFSVSDELWRSVVYYNTYNELLGSTNDSIGCSQSR